MNLEVLEQALKNTSVQSLYESQRLLHGRGKCYAGFEQVTIDWFEPIIVITQYKEAEDFNLDACKDFLLEYFASHYEGFTLKAIVFQNRILNQAQSEVIWGCVPDSLYAKESSPNLQAPLKFYIDVSSRQNSGYFLDASYARKYLADKVQGKKVLNLFSFTCAFSVAALSAGAKSVVNLDMGGGVLERGKRNHELNHLDLRSAQFIKSDIFKSWKKLHKYGRYDWIIIDPPSFQKGSFNVQKDYPRVVRALHKLLAPEAKIMACLNSPFLNESFLDTLFLEGSLNSGVHACKKVERLSNPPAFVDIDPDAGLKVMIYDYTRTDDQGQS